MICVKKIQILCQNSSSELLLSKTFCPHQRILYHSKVIFKTMTKGFFSTHFQSCQVLNVQNNWQIVNTNLSRYRSYSLQVLLDNAQGDSSQDSRTYKLQEEDFIFCLVRSIEEQAQSIENRICRILSRPKQQLKPIKDQGFRSTSTTI